MKKSTAKRIALGGYSFLIGIIDLASLTNLTGHQHPLDDIFMCVAGVLFLIMGVAFILKKPFAWYGLIILYVISSLENIALIYLMPGTPGSILASVFFIPLLFCIPILSLFKIRKGYLNLIPETDKDNEPIALKGLFITDNPLPMKKYVVRMAIISIVPSLLLAIFLGACGFLDENSGPDFSKDFSTDAFGAFIFLVVIGPFIETLFLSLGIWMLSRFITSDRIVALLSAFVWALLHSSAFRPWGLVIFWPFVVMSCAYITWLKKSWGHAIGAAFLLHAIMNSVPSILILLETIAES